MIGMDWNTIAIILTIAIITMALIIAFYSIEKNLIDYRIEREKELMRLDHELQIRHQQYDEAKEAMDEIQRELEQEVKNEP
jgi:hypothetical protein